MNFGKVFSVVSAIVDFVVYARINDLERDDDRDVEVCWRLNLVGLNNCRWKLVTARKFSKPNSEAREASILVDSR